MTRRRRGASHGILILRRVQGRQPRPRVGTIVGVQQCCAFVLVQEARRDPVAAILVQSNPDAWLAQTGKGALSDGDNAGERTRRGKPLAQRLIVLNFSKTCSVIAGEGVR